MSPNGSFLVMLWLCFANLPRCPVSFLSGRSTPEIQAVKDSMQSGPQATHYKSDVIKGLSKQGEAEDLTDKPWPRPC